MRKSAILAEAESIKAELVKIRRDIHRHPELGWRVERTAALGERVMQEHGLAVGKRVAGTGVVGLLRGSRRGKTIAIRTDMDALPIHEQRETSYSSRTEGVMHACGHDAHVAMAMGAAMLLARRKARLKGNVKFILQPNEEVPPGGAHAMIREGVLSNPRVHAIIALHVDPIFPIGQVGIRAGTVMSSTDTLTITVTGRAAHAALPHLSIDAIATAARIILGLQTIVSRQMNPMEPVVISIGTIEGGSSANVVADRVKMVGTVRTLSPAVRRGLPGMIRRVVRNIAGSAGATCRVQYVCGTPLVINDEGMCDLLRDAGSTILGVDNIVDIEPCLGAEDFAFFQELVPGCLVRLGVRNEKKGITHPWHHPEFDIDENALPLGAAVLAEAAVKFLSK